MRTAAVLGPVHHEASDTTAPRPFCAITPPHWLCIYRVIQVRCMQKSCVAVTMLPVALLANALHGRPPVRYAKLTASLAHSRPSIHTQGESCIPFSHASRMPGWHGAQHRSSLQRHCAPEPEGSLRGLHASTARTAAVHMPEAARQAGWPSSSTPRAPTPWHHTTSVQCAAKQFAECCDM